MNWDPLQREVLEALGHVLYERAPTLRPGVPDDALVHALLRAAGRTPDADDAHALWRSWPSPALLRGNAVAKRALWPTLRHLRAQADRRPG